MAECDGMVGRGYSRTSVTFIGELETGRKKIERGREAIRATAGALPVLFQSGLQKKLSRARKKL